MLWVKRKSAPDSVPNHSAEHFTEHPETMLQHYPIVGVGQEGTSSQLLTTFFNVIYWLPMTSTASITVYVLQFRSFAQATDMKQLKNRFKGHH